jgi:hypothetical protein
LFATLFPSDVPVRWALSLVAIFALLAGGHTVSASSTRGGTSKGKSHAAKVVKPRAPKATKPPKVAKAPKPPKQPATRTASAVPRNEKGRIQRSAAARHAFARQTGFPHGRPGYVIDHIKPLACGGVDAPSNMQWQTIAEGKIKDRTERRGCR